METQWLYVTAYKVFITLNDLDPNFMIELFYRSSNLTHRKDDIYVHSQSTIKSGNKKLRITWEAYMELAAWQY